MCAPLQPCMCFDACLYHARDRLAFSMLKPFTKLVRARGFHNRQAQASNSRPLDTELAWCIGIFQQKKPEFPSLFLCLAISVVHISITFKLILTCICFNFEFHFTQEKMFQTTVVAMSGGFLPQTQFVVGSTSE